MEEESTTTTADQQEEVTSESLPPTGGQTSKKTLPVALLLVAPKVVAGLSWLALVAGFVVTMKVYWVVLAKRHLFHPKV